MKKPEEDTVNNDVHKIKLVASRNMLLIVSLALVIIFAVILALFFYPFPSQPGQQLSKEETCFEGVVDNECLAFASGDVNYCMKTNPEQVVSCYDEYYLGKVIKLGDPSLCQNIKDVNMRELCSSIAGGDAGQCDEVGNTDFRYACEAMLTDDISLCDIITDGVMRSGCKSISILYRAVENNDPSSCDEISLGFARVKCTAFMNQDTDFCWDSARQICSNNSYNVNDSHEAYLEGAF